jgi:hypothetical protein
VASVTNSALEGTINRVAIHGSSIYAATSRKGIQVVDMATAKSNYEAAGGTPYLTWPVSFKVNADGQGFGQDAVVQTIPVYEPASQQWFNDLEVRDFLVDGFSQPTVGATSGAYPLILVNPQGSEVLFKGPLSTSGGAALTSGAGLAFAEVGDGSWSW